MINVEGLNQEAPVSRRSRNPEEALLLWKLQYLQMHGECNILPTKKIIFPSKSHFCKMPFEKLKPIKLREMKVPMVHNGKFLVAKVIGKPFAVIGVNALIEDLNGDVEEIALYNFRYNFDNLDWIGVGIILIIKEPWLRYSSDDDIPSLWVDSPSDVIFVDPTDDDLVSQIGANQWHVSGSKDVDVIRKMANNCFIKKDYDGALMLYDRAIRYKPDLAVLYLNKALTCLKIGAFYMAYNALEIALEKGGDQEKAIYRMGQSAYGIREWQKAAEHFANVCKDFPKNAAAPEQLKRAIARLNEKQTGKFDFKSMYLESKKENPEIDVADYQGPIKIVNMNKKGRGVIATEDIKKGTLLAVSKAFASGYNDDFSELLSALKKIPKDVGSADEILQAILTIHNLQRNPQKAKEIYDLCAGDYMEENEELPFGVIDAGRIQKICEYNAFASENVTEDAKTHLSLNTHLYILPSYLNHSCLANCHRTFYHDVMVIHATTDIKKGDELCLTYISPLNELSVRKEKLNGWQFTCECQLCEADAKDTHFSKRRKMMLEFQEYSKIHEKTPQKVIDEGEKLLPKIRETYVERKNFKIDLVLVLNILSSAYEYIGNIEKEIKCLQEIITHAENCPIYALGFDIATKNLAICYSLTGNYVEAKKFFQKASDLSFCTDLEHFKMLYPEVTQYLP